MSRATWSSAAALLAAASCALASAPPRQAEPVGADHATIKLQQVAWEEGNGFFPGENNGPALRGVCPFSVTRTPALPIPDFSGGVPGMAQDQMVSGGDPLLNVRVQLIITHTFQGDIIATLRHDVSGVEVTLIDRPGVPQDSTVGFGADNFGDNTTGIPFVLDDTAATRYDSPPAPVAGTNNVTGSWLPDDPFLTPLSVFNGLTANTTWTLTVTDNAGIDTGVIQRWSICSDNLIGSTVPTGIGSATPNPTNSGVLVEFRVQASPAVNPTSTGLAVVADLSGVGGSFSQTLFDDGTNGDDVAGDNVFTYETVISSGPGAIPINFTVSDAQARSSNGAFTLNVIAGNDVCETAEALTVGVPVIGNNTGATNDPGQPPCSGLSTFNLGVWYTVVGNGSVLNATTCSPNTVLNTRVYVYSGTCGAFTCVGAATGTTPACTPSNAASVSFCSNSGQTYYILVTNDTTGTGQFELGVFDAGSCPMNDDCPGDMVSAPSSTPGTTIGLTPSGLTSCGANSADAFYNFTPPVAGSYTIDTCGSAFDTRLSVFTDCSGTQIGCNDDACGTQSRLILDLDAGTTYYIRVSAFAAATTGPFVLNISAPPIPTGGCCVGQVCSIQTQADCTSNGGSYLGDDSNCDGNGPIHSYSSAPFLAIPENQCTAGFVTDSITVPDNFVIADVSVRVQITHTFIGDLRIRLTNGATTVAVWERHCGLNDNMDVTFDDEGATVVCATPTVGTYVPSGAGAGSLSDFDGQSSLGTWTLEICDGANLDIGTLDSWELILQEQDPALCGPAFCDADWCQDGVVGVPDIFCFLGEWFANVPAARCYGGTCGVPAIFAFLGVWFATGIGPCP